METLLERIKRLLPGATVYDLPYEKQPRIWVKVQPTLLTVVEGMGNYLSDAALQMMVYDRLKLDLIWQLTRAAESRVVPGAQSGEVAPAGAP